MTTSTFPIADLAATDAFGRRLGELLFPGAIIALVGPLGAGKTHLVRAIARGLGIANENAVTSPTFVLIQEYTARLPIFHFDAYRLIAPNEFLELGVHEYYEMSGVCLIEWADRVESVIPAAYLRIEITPIDPEKRQFQVTARGEQYVQLLQKLVLEFPQNSTPQ